MRAHVLCVPRVLLKLGSPVGGVVASLAQPAQALMQAHACSQSGLQCSAAGVLCRVAATDPAAQPCPSGLNYFILQVLVPPSQA